MVGAPHSGLVSQTGKIRNPKSEIRNLLRANSAAWMGGLQDWCLRRQLWWRHRIPVWYPKPGKSEIRNPKSEIYVGVNPPPDPENWEQDPDVLDTWFS